MSCYRETYPWRTLPWLWLVKEDGCSDSNNYYNVGTIHYYEACTHVVSLYTCHPSTLLFLWYIACGRPRQCNSWTPWSRGWPWIPWGLRSRYTQPPVWQCPSSSSPGGCWCQWRPPLLTWCRLALLVGLCHRGGELVLVTFFVAHVVIVAVSYDIEPRHGAVFR